MEHKTSESIILRTKDFGESDLLVTFFSDLHGNLKGIAKGARRSLKRFANSLGTFSLVNVEFRVRRKSDLVWLETCELLDGFHGIRSDYNRLIRASYMVELAETLFPSSVPSQEMFQLLKGALSSLSNKNNIEEIMIAFGVRAMGIGGFGINLSGCIRCGRRYKGEGRALFHPPSGSIACLGCERESALTPGMDPAAVHVLQQLQESKPAVFDGLHFDTKVIRELKSVLAAHLEHCLGKRLKTARYFQ